MNDQADLGRKDIHRFNRMEFTVLPDDHELLKDVELGCIGSDGVQFYVGETLWAEIKDKLIAVSPYE